MPTGYTAAIESGEITTAAEYLMRCARAFGACIEIRDEPLDKPIPEFKVDGRYQQAIEYDRGELDRIKRMSIGEARSFCEGMRLETIKQNEQRSAKNIALRNKYEPILKEVEAWTPPTAGHENLKSFAIEQIKLCMPTLKECEVDPAPEMLDPEDWLLVEIEWREKCLERSIKRFEEHKASVAERNKWIKDLRDSL